jgi:cellulose synthase/poly-beta-1,6-N-acetylglucosamine synthase-like glycosyltransferase
MIFIEFLACFAAAVLLVPVIVLFIQILLSLTSPDRTRQIPGERRRLAVLMPAHNEASAIAASIRSIVPQLSATDRLVVVADNCSDETHTTAKSEGAEVIVRTNQMRRGKGFALDFGIQYLQEDPPEVVVIIDADCFVAPGTIDKLARLTTRTDRPVQALYLMHAPRNTTPQMRIAEFAFLVKNLVRPTGLHRLGLPCQLMGTGMSFPWMCISTAPLATGHIVEDLKLGVELAYRGYMPLFCSEALVTSRFASANEGTQSQRTRWEHGHIGVILSDAPRLLLASILKMDVRLMSMALDLSVPPLALLALLNAAIWIVSVIILAGANMLVPVVISTTSLGLLVISVLLAWGRYGRRVVSLVDLGFAIFYAAVKIPLYARFLVARQMDWVRSKRDHE